MRDLTFLALFLALLGVAPAAAITRTKPALSCTVTMSQYAGAVAELVGIEVGVVSGVINLESSGVEASDWRLRHEATYHEA